MMRIMNAREIVQWSLYSGGNNRLQMAGAGGPPSALQKSEGIIGLAECVTYFDVAGL